MKSNRIALLAVVLGLGCGHPNGLSPLAQAGSLDQLDPAKIPAEERLAFQPKELVGVIRSFNGSDKSYGTWVAFSPDGKWLACAGWDKVVRIWSVATLEQVAALEGHAIPVLALTFSPDSKLLASAGGDKTVRLWDVSGAKPKEKTTLVGHEGIIWGLAFSADSKMLASAGGADHTVRLWDLGGEQAKQKTVVTTDIQDVYSPGFSPDGKILAIGGWNTLVKLYDISGKKPLGPIELSGHTKVYPLTFAPDGKTLYTADHPGLEGNIRLWDMTGAQPKEKSVLKTDAQGYNALAFTPDGKRLAATGDNKKIFVWDAGSKKLLHEWQFAEHVHGISFAPDGKHLAAGSLKGAIYILRLPN